MDAALLAVLMPVAALALLFTGFPVAFVLGGVAILFAGLNGALGGTDLIANLPARIYGTVLTNETMIAIPLFILMGAALEKSRVAEDMMRAMGQLFQRLRGGLALSVILVGTLLAASTGIVGASVVAIGMIALPTLLAAGYDRRLACGTVAAVGTLGQIIPPSIVLIILGDQISNAYQEVQSTLQQRAWENGVTGFVPDAVSVGDLFAGAMIPGLILAGLYGIYVLLRGRSIDLTGPPATAISIRAMVSGLLPPLLLIVAVLGSILAGIAPPSEAAALGAVGALLLAADALNRRTTSPTGGLPYHAPKVAMAAFIGAFAIAPVGASSILLVGLVGIGVLAGAHSLNRLWHAGILRPAMEKTMGITGMIFAIVIAAAAFSLTFRDLGGDQLIRGLLNDMPGGSTAALLAVMFLIFALGFFLDFVEICLIVVPVVAPVLLLGGDVSPVWLGVLIAMNLQTSFLTPPFGFALFYLRGVAPPDIATSDIYRGAVPFIGIQILAISMVWFWPRLATWLPDTVFG